MGIPGQLVTGCRDSCFESGMGWVGKVLSVGKYCRQLRWTDNK